MGPTPVICAVLAPKQPGVAPSETGSIATGPLARIPAAPGSLGLRPLREGVMRDCKKMAHSPTKNAAVPNRVIVRQPLPYVEHQPAGVCETPSDEQPDRFGMCAR